MYVVYFEISSNYKQLISNEPKSKFNREGGVFVWGWSTYPALVEVGPRRRCESRFGHRRGWLTWGADQELDGMQNIPLGPCKSRLHIATAASRKRG